MVNLLLKYSLYPLWAVMIVLRFLNVMEPPDDPSLRVPGRDYPAILSWSKITRISGLALIIFLTMSGNPLDSDLIIALLTYAGGEVGYRWRQAQNKPEGETT